MTDTTPGPEPAHSAFRVLAALADLGEATAAAIAQHAGLGYSTVTPKLRAWETSGHAQKYRHAATSQTLWRLTPIGRAATGAQGENPKPPADTPATDTAGPETAEGTDRPASSSPAEPALSDLSPTESDATPPRTGTDIPRDDEQPAPEVGAGQPVPIPHEAAADADPQPADPQPAEPAHDDSSHDAAVADDTSDQAAASGDNTAAATPPPAKRKRPAGALEAGALAILRHRPDDTFTVNDLRKLIDNADQGTGYPAVSAGALANALTKLTGKGQADTVQEKPATYRATPATD